MCMLSKIAVILLSEKCPRNIASRKLNQYIYVVLAKWLVRHNEFCNLRKCNQIFFLASVHRVFPRLTKKKSFPPKDAMPCIAPKACFAIISFLLIIPKQSRAPLIFFSYRGNGKTSGTCSMNIVW